MNQCFIQITGPFVFDQDIIPILKKQYDFSKIVKLGIQTRLGRKCRINGEEIEIGKTGIYEISDVDIDSIVFLQDETELTIVDCIVE